MFSICFAETDFQKTFDNNDLLLSYNNEGYQVNKRIAYGISLFIQIKIDDKPLEEVIVIGPDNIDLDGFELVVDMMNGECVVIDHENYLSLKNIAKILSISRLFDEVEKFEKHLKELYKNRNLSLLQSFESIIFSVNQENYENLADNLNILINDLKSEARSIPNTFFKKNPIFESEYTALVKLIIEVTRIKYLSAPLMFKFAFLLTENSPEIKTIFAAIVHKMKSNSFKWYLMHHLWNSGICPQFQYYNFDYDEKNPDQSKILRINGVNPSVICQIIRTDDLDKLQEYLAQNTSFNLNQNVPFSQYESKPMLNNCSFINYSAFFASLKCFKYFLVNEANFDTNSLRFIIAGGNNEILRLYMNKNGDFRNALEYCIEFHQHSLYDWIANNQIKIAPMNSFCTYHITDKKYIYQRWFQCIECDLFDGLGCCYHCAMHCHFDHLLVNCGYVKAYCDCGHSRCPEIQKINNSPIIYALIDRLVAKCIKYCNYSTFLKLIEQGANLRSIYPKLFTLASNNNDTLVARIAFELGPTLIDPDTQDIFKNDKNAINSELSMLIKQAQKNGIINKNKNKKNIGDYLFH